MLAVRGKRGSLRPVPEIPPRLVKPTLTGCGGDEAELKSQLLTYEEQLRERNITMRERNAALDQRRCRDGRTRPAGPPIARAALCIDSVTGDSQRRVEQRRSQKAAPKSGAAEQIPAAAVDQDQAQAAPLNLAQAMAIVDQKVVEKARLAHQAQAAAAEEPAPAAAEEPAADYDYDYDYEAHEQIRKWVAGVLSADHDVTCLGAPFCVRLPRWLTEDIRTYHQTKVTVLGELEAAESFAKHTRQNTTAALAAKIKADRAVADAGVRCQSIKRSLWSIMKRTKNKEVTFADCRECNKHNQCVEGLCIECILDDQ